MEAKKIVGWNIRRLRVARAMTIETLAGDADVSAPYLAQLERGEVNVGIVILERLAKALAAKLTELFVEPSPGAKAPKPLPAGRKPTKVKRR